MDPKLTFKYDHEADILYIDKCPPYAEQETEELGDEVLARQLRVNERTLEKWEQGRAKPNKQAATLILLTRKFPDTLERLAQ
jgi:hypothetical protein